MKLLFKLVIILLSLKTCASLTSDGNQFGAKKYGIVNYFEKDQEYIIDYVVESTPLVKSIRIYYYTKQDGTWVQNSYVTYLEKKTPQGLFAKRLAFTTDSLQAIRMKVILYNYTYGHTGSGHSIAYRDTIRLENLFGSPLAENK